MKTSYVSHVLPSSYTQSEKLPGTNQTTNSTGTGHSYVVDDWTRLRRFLILGNPGGTFYASEKKLTRENAACVVRCLGLDYKRTIDTIVEVSVRGRAPKNDPAVFALALAASLIEPKADDPAVVAIRTYALSKLNQVCRIGTHLFQFVEAVNSLRGWGKSLQRAVANWYTEKSPDDLAYQVTKYAQRRMTDGEPGAVVRADKKAANIWSHRDVLRLCHAQAPTSNHDAVFRYVVDGVLPGVSGGRTGYRLVKGEKIKFIYGDTNAYVPFLEHVEAVKKAADAKEVARLIRDHGLPREVVPTQYLNSVEVWDALLHAGKYGMPLEAMVRNLGKMTAIGLIKPLSEAEQYVIGRLTDAVTIKYARLHPLKSLLALGTYRQGHGEKGKLTWIPSTAVCAALDKAFHLGFDAVEPTGKRFLIALDVSGSMSYPSSYIAGTNITAREASAALALVTLKTEPYCHVIGFTGRDYTVNYRPLPTQHLSYGIGNETGTGVEPLPLSSVDSLTDTVKKVSGLPMGPTDCALPWLYAADRGIQADVCITMTDNETWFGKVHPSVACEQYRKKTGIPAKNVIIGMTPTEFSMADPNDPMSLNVVGFDTSVPAVIADFVSG